MYQGSNTHFRKFHMEIQLLDILKLMVIRHYVANMIEVHQKPVPQPDLGKKLQTRIYEQLCTMATPVQAIFSVTIIKAA